MPIKIRRSLELLCGWGAMAGVTCWFTVFAYADWLRFSSPRAPNSATGQVIYEKAVKGVFYITQSQAFWAQKIILPIWLAMMAAGLLSRLLATKNDADDRGGPVWTVLGVVYLIGMFASLGFGDVLLAPLFESLSPPVL